MAEFKKRVDNSPACFCCVGRNTQYINFQCVNIRCDGFCRLNGKRCGIPVTNDSASSFLIENCALNIVNFAHTQHHHSIHHNFPRLPFALSTEIFIVLPSRHDRFKTGSRKIAAGTGSKAQYSTTFYLGKWMEKPDLL